MSEVNVKILGIESSCDETSAAISADRKILSNIIASQAVHRNYGGVVPELASRAHQQNIVPVVDAALKKAGVKKSEINAIAFTRGPGLMGSLLVGVSFAKALGMALQVPIIEVNHLQAHILAHFIDSNPSFPFLCLTVSGGHTQIVKVVDYLEMEILGQTLDDAAGECFDKAAKIMGLPYPGGPLIDKYAAQGNSKSFAFPIPHVPGLNFSFSGLKTSFLYLVDDLRGDTTSLQADLCASLQHCIVSILMEKVNLASKLTGIKEIAIAGGVSANSGLRKALALAAAEHGYKTYIPRMEYCTDNAAMIAITGYFKYLKKEFAGLDITPLARQALISLPL